MMSNNKRRKNPGNQPVDNAKTKVVEIIPTLTNDDIYKAIKDLQADINNLYTGRDMSFDRINYLLRDIEIRLVKLEKASKPWYSKIYWNIVGLWEKSTR